MRGRRQDRVQRRSEGGVQPTPPAGQPEAGKKSSGRESIESFVVVFLAFLIWSIEAEGFVIPTG